NFVAAPGGSTALSLFTHALAGGGAALNAPAGLVEGHHADIVSLDTTAVPYLAGDQMLDHWLFAGGVFVDCVWARGRKQ
ncbi:formimidoylglutamate deiminase, partial [Rhizobium johnstonii]